MYVRTVSSSESHGEVMKQTDFKQLGSNSCGILDESMTIFSFLLVLLLLFLCFTDVIVKCSKCAGFSDYCGDK